MVTESTLVTPEFAGTKKFQTIAARIFEIMRGRGMFMADDAPIRVPLATLQEFLASVDNTKPADVETAVTENPSVFGLETVDDAQVVVTTRVGKVPNGVQPANVHSFSARFLTPQPRPERPAPVKREPVRIDPNWATYSIPDFDDELEEDESFEFEDDEPVVTEVIATPVEVEEVAEPVVEAVVEPEPVVEEVEVVKEAAPTPAPAAARDLSGFSDEAIAQAIDSQLHNDPRVASFGGHWMAEERVPRLSRGDLRKMKEYIEEQDQPLTDGMLVTDILNVRQNAADFDLLQFAVSFRLSREHRDFEFVGTRDQRFWSTSSLPQIGTTRRKPNDIGTDYRFLVDEVPADVAPRSVSSADHVLTFYEYSLGLLPLNEEMQKLLPKPLYPDQRSAVLTFEIPQSYTTYLVELRYPTPNRGGFLLGLDDFYAENLVPGAMISVSATENDGHYKVEYLAGKDQSARLLELDDRRSPRYLFRPTSFACEVSPEWLVSEDRFPKLGSEKPLDDRARRRPEAVIEVTFDRIGIEDGDALVTTFDELLAAVNVERPFSPTYLRSVVEGHAGITNDGADTLSYVAG